MPRSKTSRPVTEGVVGRSRSASLPAVDVPPPALVFGWIAQRSIDKLRGRWRTRGDKPQHCTKGDRIARRAVHALVLALMVTETPAAYGADQLAAERAPSSDMLKTIIDNTTDRRFYVGTRSRLGKTHDTFFPASGSIFDSDYDVSIGGGAVLGYGTGPLLGPLGLRGEVEVGYFEAAVDTFNVNGARRPSEQSVGTMNGFTGFANGYIDAHLGALGMAQGTPLARLAPYVGVGVGVARIGLDDYGTFDEGIVMDDWDTSVAFQLSTGLRAAITERMSIEVGYRREVIPDLEFKARDHTRSSMDITRDVFTLGLQRRF